MPCCPWHNMWAHPDTTPFPAPLFAAVVPPQPRSLLPHLQRLCRHHLPKMNAATFEVLHATLTPCEHPSAIVLALPPPAPTCITCAAIISPVEQPPPNRYSTPPAAAMAGRSSRVSRIHSWRELALAGQRVRMLPHVSLREHRFQGASRSALIMLRVRGLGVLPVRGFGCAACQGVP